MTLELHEDNHIPELIRQLTGEHTLTIGVFGAKAETKQKNPETGEESTISMGDLANVHEFGCQIKVTDKMRGYLASQGLYLKKDTEYINIPERSFIRSSWDENQASFINHVTKSVDKALQKRIPISFVLDALGLEMKGKMQAFMDDGKVKPELSDFAKQQRANGDGSKGPNPLVDTGDLRDSIDYEVT